MYVRVWEYEVASEHVDAFVAAYGATGEWARLFQRGRGHLGTELYRRTGDETRFITVDRWADEESWGAFLEGWAGPYQELDAVMDSLTESERSLLEGTS
jgi:heme-degrading monooxygenase HmoA